MRKRYPFKMRHKEFNETDFCVFLPGECRRWIWLQNVEMFLSGDSVCFFDSKYFNFFPKINKIKHQNKKFTFSLMLAVLFTPTVWPVPKLRDGSKKIFHTEEIINFFRRYAKKRSTLPSKWFKKTYLDCCIYTCLNQQLRVATIVSLTSFHKIQIQTHRNRTHIIIKSLV